MTYDLDDPVQAAVARQHADFANRMQALEQRGVQLQINGRETFVVEFLLDQLIGGTPERIAMEARWIEHCLAAVTGAEQQLAALEAQERQRRLTEGVALDPRVQQQIAHGRDVRR